MQNNFIIVQSNDLIQKITPSEDASVVLTVPERRIVLFLMSKIRRDSAKLELVSICVSDFCREWGASCGGRQYTALQAAVDRLKRKTFFVNGDRIKWLSDASDYTSRQMVLQLDATLEPFLLGQRKNFTSYNLYNVLGFTSPYAFRIYEYMRSLVGMTQYRMRIDDAYSKLSGDRYSTLSAFKRIVLDPAIADINASTDINITYSVEKKYAKPTHILFGLKLSSGKSGRTSRGVQQSYTSSRNIDIVDYLISRHPDLIVKSSKGFTHPDHDSISFNHCLWYRHADSTYGDIIDYLTRFGGISRGEAIAEIQSYCVDDMCGVTVGEVENVDISKTGKAFIAPQNVYKNLSRVKNYLLSRGISKELTEEMVRTGQIYADKYSNCVFSSGSAGNRICIVKGTGKTRYNKIVADRPNNYWMFTAGHMGCVYVFESPIDALSYYQLYRHDGVYVAMGGTKQKTLQRIVADYPNATIHICVDWDTAGINFAKNNSMYPHVIPNGNIDGTKDWNDILCAGHKAMEKNDDDLNGSVSCGEIDNAENEDMFADFDDCDFIPF